MTEDSNLAARGWRAEGMLEAGLRRASLIELIECSTNQMAERWNGSRRTADQLGLDVPGRQPAQRLRFKC